jgi:addiction module HigA family antidote
MMHSPLHPGEIVKEVLIEGASLSVTEAAAKLDVSRSTLSRLLNGHSGISPDMALRLAKLLPNTDITLWMNLQRDYDVWQVMKHSKKIHVKPLNRAA